MTSAILMRFFGSNIASVLRWNFANHYRIHNATNKQLKPMSPRTNAMFLIIDKIFITHKPISAVFKLYRPLAMIDARKRKNAKYRL
nr:hypothetical protein [uncultured Campylobacter sp.]